MERFAEANALSTCIHHIHRIMLPSSQPSRPKVFRRPQNGRSLRLHIDVALQVQAPSHSNPLFQQQTRHFHTHQADSTAANRPQNQIEAMPPSKTLTMALPDQRGLSPLYDPALTHPVFFGKWHKPPFPMPFNNGFSPVATGYVFGDQRVRAGSTTKL